MWRERVGVGENEWERVSVGESECVWERVCVGERVWERGGCLPSLFK